MYPSFFYNFLKMLCNFYLSIKAHHTGIVWTNTCWGGVCEGGFLQAERGCDDSVAVLSELCFLFIRALHLLFIFCLPWLTVSSRTPRTAAGLLRVLSQKVIWIFQLHPPTCWSNMLHLRRTLGPLMLMLFLLCGKWTSNISTITISIFCI